MKNMKFQIQVHFVENYIIAGQGAYAIVAAAKDKTTGRKVAIKKFESVFEDKLSTQRTLRELRFGRLLKHDNIMGTETILLPKSREQFEDM